MWTADTRHKNKQTRVGDSSQKRLITYRVSGNGLDSCIFKSLFRLKSLTLDQTVDSNYSREISHGHKWITLEVMRKARLNFKGHLVFNYIIDNQLTINVKVGESNDSINVQMLDNVECSR